MIAPIRLGTARRLGLDQPEPPVPPRFNTWDEAFAALHREIAAAYAKAFAPTDAQKAAMFRRAMGVQQ